MAADGTATERFRRSATTALIVVSLANLLNYFDRGIFYLMLDPISKEFGFTNTQLGFLAGAFALLFALMSLPLAWAADRTRRLTVMSICIAIWSTATALTGLAASFWQLFAARVGVGIGEAGCLPAGTSLLGDHFPPERRSRAMAIYMGAGLVGTMMGFMLVGILADHVGWRYALLYASLPGLALAPLALWLREPKRGQYDAKNSADQPWGEAMVLLLRTPAYLLLVTSFAGIGLAFGTIGSWGPTYFVRAFGLSLTDVGIRFGLAFGLSAALGTFAGGYMTSRLVQRNRRWEFRVPAIACIAAIPLFEAGLHASTPGQGFALIALASFVAYLCFGPALSVFHIVAPPATRATAVAAGGCLSGLIGSFGGPLIVGALTDAFLPVYGDAALRYALSIITTVLVVPALLYLIAGRLVFPAEPTRTMGRA